MLVLLLLLLILLVLVLVLMVLILVLVLVLLPLLQRRRLPSGQQKVLLLGVVLHVVETVMAANVLPHVLQLAPGSAQRTDQDCVHHE